MATIDFDVAGARESGFSDSEIADYLASKTGYDIAGARKNGFADVDIISHLTPRPKEPESEAAPTPDVPKSGTMRGMAKGAARGVVEGAGRMVEGLGAAYQSGATGLINLKQGQQDEVRRQVDVMDAIDAGRVEDLMKPDKKRAYGSQYDPGQQFIDEYLNADPDQRQAIRQRVAGEIEALPKVADTDAGRAASIVKGLGEDVTAGGKAIGKWAERAIPLSPEEEQRSSVIVSRIVGGLGTYIGAAMAGGLPALIGAGGLEGMGVTYEDAKKKGASDEDASKAAFINGVVQGGLNAVPPLQAMRAMNAVPQAFRGEFVKAALEVVAASGTLLTFSQLSKLAENVVAKNTYDPSRELTHEMGENLVETGIAGAVVPLGGAAVSAAVRAASPRRAPTPAEVGREVMDAPTVDDAILTARETIDQATLADTTVQAQEFGGRIDQEQAAINELFGGLNAGDVQRAPDGTYHYQSDEGRSWALKPWDGTPSPDTIPAAVVDAQRAHYERQGVRVVYFENDPSIPFDGAVDPSQPNTIFLSNKPQRNAAQVGAHELTHVLERTTLPDGTNLGDLLFRQVSEGLTPEGRAYADRLFGSTAPGRRGFPDGPDGDAMHADAVTAHMVREMGAELGAEAPKFQTFLPRVVDAVEARYGTEVAKSVLQKVIAGIQEVMNTLRQFFFRPADGLEYGQPETVSQKWVTNLEQIHGTLAQMYAERFGGPAALAAPRAKEALPAPEQRAALPYYPGGPDRPPGPPTPEQPPIVTPPPAPQRQLPAPALVTPPPRPAITPENVFQPSTYRSDAPSRAAEAPEAVVETQLQKEQAAVRAMKAARETTNVDPTDGQKEADNYLKGRATIHGLPFVMENPKGSTRSGVDADGNPWEATLPADYGYLSRTKGADGDQVDVYIGPDPTSTRVWVVDQIDPKTGKFDEHKVMLGTRSVTEARAIYHRAFSDGTGPQRIGSITQMSIDQFKAWLENGDTKRPVGKIKARAETPVGKERAKLADMKPKVPEAAEVAPAESPRTEPAAEATPTKEDTPVFSPRVRIEGTELAPLGADIKTLRKAALDYYRAQLQGRTVNNPNLGEIVFTGRGRREMRFASANPDKLRLVPALPDMLREGVVDRTSKDTAGRQGVVAYHRLTLPVQVGDRQLFAGVVVEERTNGKLYYNHFVGNDEASLRAASDPGSKTGARRAGEAPDVAVADDGINIDLAEPKNKGQLEPEAARTDDAAARGEAPNAEAGLPDVGGARGPDAPSESQQRVLQEGVRPSEPDADVGRARRADTESEGERRLLREDVRAPEAGGQAGGVKPPPVDETKFSPRDQEQVIDLVERIERRKRQKAGTMGRPDAESINDSLRSLSREEIGHLTDRDLDALHAYIEAGEFGSPKDTASLYDAVQGELDLRGRGAMQDRAANQDGPQFSPRITADEPRIVGRNPTRKYTAEQVEAFEHVGRSAKDRTWGEIVSEVKQDLGKKLIREFLDPYVGLKERDPAGYMAARLANSNTGAVDMFNTWGTLKFGRAGYEVDQQTGGVADVVRRLGPEAHDFLSWVAGNRAERLKAEDRENLFRQKDIAAYKGLNQGRLDFDYELANGKTTRSREAAYLDALKQYETMRKNLLDVAVEGGLLKRDVAQGLWENPFYVPFYRLAEADNSRGFVGPTTVSGFVKQSAGKKLKGGTEKLNADLWENFFGNAAHMIDAAIRNRASNRILDKAVEDGVVQKITAQEYDHKMSKAEKADTVWTIVDGEKVYWKVDDPFLLKAITAMDYVQSSTPLMNIGRAAKKVLQVGVAASPHFQIRNLLRDSVQALAVSPISRNVFRNFSEGFSQQDVTNRLQNVARAVAGQEMQQGRVDRETADAVAGGATMRYAAGVDQSFGKASNYLDTDSKIAAFWQYFRRAGQASTELMGFTENVNRLALYKQLGEKGEPKDLRAFESRDLADFTLVGANPLVRHLVELVPYMNAWAQGLYKVGRTAAADDKNVALAVGGKVARQATTKLAVAIATLTAIDLALDGIFADDEDFKARSEFDRNANYWFKAFGQEWRIPRPFEVGALSRLASIWTQSLYNTDMSAGRAWKNTREIFLTQMAFDPTPQVIKPLLDVAYKNESRTGAPIETRGMERLRPEYRAGPETTLVSKGVSDVTNKAVRGLFGDNARVASPVQLDYLVQAYTGWLGTTALQIADTAVRAVSSEPEKPSKDLLGKVTGGLVTGDKSSERSATFYTNLLYRQGEAIQQAYNTYQDLVKRGRGEEARDYLEDNRDLIVKRGGFDQVIRLEGDLNEQIRAVTANPRLSGEQKRVQLMRLNSMKNRAAQSLFAPRE